MAKIHYSLRTRAWAWTLKTNPLSNMFPSEVNGEMNNDDLHVRPNSLPLVVAQLQVWKRSWVHVAGKIKFHSVHFNVGLVRQKLGDDVAVGGFSVGDCNQKPRSFTWFLLTEIGTSIGYLENCTIVIFATLSLLQSYWQLTSAWFQVVSPVSL